MDWRERINVAERYGFSAEDERDASQWLTCAVGELHPEQARILNRKSINPEALYPLYHLGLAFAASVKAGDVDSALGHYEEIKGWNAD